jgi:hypothetical protein
MATPDTSETRREPEPWYDVFDHLIAKETTAGRMVRVSLPGSSHPILVEAAGAWCGMLTIRDGAGRLYYVASPAGVVLITEPVELPPPGSKPYWMSVDGTDAKPA